MATLLVLVAAVGAATYARIHAGPSDQAGGPMASVVLSLRLQAAAVAALSGSALAVAGTLMQGLFRNPLADPGVVGVGAGANLGGMLAMTTFEIALRGGQLGLPQEVVLPLGCAVGAFAALGVLLVAMRRFRETLSLLLVGVMLGMLLASVGAVVQALVTERWGLARAVMTFTMGDISGKGMRHVAMAAPLVGAGILAAWLLGRPLDLLQTGEDEARTLGLDLPAIRFWAVVWTAMLVAAAVALGGNVLFVGLMIPHALRRWAGNRHRVLVPTAALGGAAFVIGCDAISAACGTRSLIPLGVITGLLGAPLFFVLLIRHHRSRGWT